MADTIAHTKLAVGWGTLFTNLGSITGGFAEGSLRILREWKSTIGVRSCLHLGKPGPSNCFRQTAFSICAEKTDWVPFGKEKGGLRRGKRNPQRPRKKP